ncbi:MAG: Asp-tRNA(Asn)/Glu-tRNA(Gln) amidotransferase subunit GatA [bacterium]
MNLKELTIRKIQEGLKNKEFTCVELVEASLEKIEKDKEINTFITVLGEEALAIAKQQDKNSKWLPLSGVPFGIKDVLQYEGHRATCASKILDKHVSSYTATAVQKLLDQGAIPVGKLNCDEFAMGSSNENSAYGPVHNPNDHSLVPGGSSGGSAASVASGEVVFSLGTDTGGSIRQPASLCGVVGLKPTYGRVSRYGLIALASSLDQIGPIANTVEDAAIVLQAMAGDDHHDATAVAKAVPDYLAGLDADVKGMTVGLPREYLAEGIEKEVKEKVLKAIERMEELGVNVKEISLPHSPQALATYYLIQPAETSSNLAKYDGMRYGERTEGDDFETVIRETRGKGFGAEVRRRIMLGTYILSAGYYDAYYKQALKMRRLVSDDFTKAFHDVDVIAGPTSPVAAWKLGEKVNDPMAMYLSDIFTVPANLAGLPGLSMNCGWAEKNGKRLPVGLQLQAAPWQEEKLLCLAFHLERLFR